MVTIEQRYADAPSAELEVPLIEAFVAMKLSVWHDRRAPRDLYDLHAIGAINDEAKKLYCDLGPGVHTPDLWGHRRRRNGTTRSHINVG